MNDLATTLENAYRLHEAGDVAAAQQAYKAILAGAPDHPETHHLLGITYYQQGTLEAALPHLLTAAVGAPDVARYWNTLGLVQRRHGEVDAAEHSLQQALSLKADYAEAANNLALLYLDTNRVDAALPRLAQAAALLPDNVDVLRNYAHTLRDDGQWEKAVAVYQQIVALAPTEAQHHVNLAYALLGAGDEAAALTAYGAAAELDPTNETVVHMRAALQGESPATAPIGYVSALFDTYAPDFDRHLATLEYTVPQQLGALLEGVATATPKGQWRGLDLGCGTGLCGRFVKPLCAQLVGVDISAGMLAKCQETGLYTALHRAEVVAWLMAERESYDLMLAADLLIYVGDTAPLFEAAVPRLAAGGVLALSIEVAPEDAAAPYVLCKSGRYAHKKSHLEALAAQHGLNIIHREEIALRRDKAGVISGFIYLLQAP